MIKLRPATRDDLPLLRHWDAQPHVIEATGTFEKDSHDWLAEWFPPLRGWIEMLIAELDGRPIGVVQVIDPAEDETHYWGETEPDLCALDIWLGDLADSGKGHGSEIMRQALARCFADPKVNAVLLDPLASNTRAHRLYERLGFRAVERRMFAADDCVVYRIDRENAKLRPS
ncbi:GNAT family N-acetyltransferase [Aestuariivirga litoralis]|uniref:GNAT family N-acetyltransferase n=1 Tax=Aestuariivirga litoralis TaxID=2650924 RepID=UPI0018C6C052|nr:GNAT family N-acetyltransferase [Aestuariivirga litoralis]MBG1231600.1 acetyltransferase [Aestuariivirga litoralis]